MRSRIVRDSVGRVAGADQLEHQVGLDRVLLGLAQPGEVLKRSSIRSLHGVQLVHDAAGADGCRAGARR
jgi:hypothetical protein